MSVKVNFQHFIDFALKLYLSVFGYQCFVNDCSPVATNIHELLAVNCLKQSQK